MKPKCALIGENGNIFNLLCKAKKALQDVGYYREADEMVLRATSSQSYMEALSIICEYVEVY